MKKDFPSYHNLKTTTRRHFLKSSSIGLGAIALGMLGENEVMGKTVNNPLRNSLPDFIPSAKRVIYLHMAGSPSQLELFDYKPELMRLNNQLCPPPFLKEKNLRL